MTQTLYRKYRPGRFSDVVAQEHIITTLQNEISSGKIAHAYLFSGPRGIGKTTIARIFAKSLNCLSRDGGLPGGQGIEPCDKCLACLEIKDGRSMDLVEIDAASNRGINEIRELKEQTKYTPTRLKYKVFIIDEVHMLTTEAFNALLKTLEEPPAYAIFILATTEAHKLPETIISRCQRFDFKKVSFNEVIGHLTKIIKAEEMEVEDEVIASIARISEGYLRDAVSLLGQIMSLGEKKITLKQAALVLPVNDWHSAVAFCCLLLSRQTNKAIELIGEMYEAGFDLEHFNKTAIEVMRKILLAVASKDNKYLYEQFGEKLFEPYKKELAIISAEQLVFALEVLLEAQLSFKNTVLPQLPLEIAVVKITTNNNSAENKKDIDAIGPANKNNGSGGSFSEPGIKQPKKEEQVDIAFTKLNEPAKEEVIKAVITEEILTEAIDFDQVKSKWPEVIEALKEFNHSLAASAKLGTPLRMKGNKVVLGFKFKFHFERLKEQKNLEKIQNVLARVFQTKLSIDGEIDENFVQEDFINAGQKQNSMVKDVLEALGGQVVS